MIKKEDFVNILNNKICPICKSSSKIEERANNYNCMNCKVFYFGIGSFTKSMYFGYRYHKYSVFIFLLQNNGNIEKFSVENNMHLDPKNNIHFNIDKIPETIEELDKLYNQVEKIKVFK